VGATASFVVYGGLVLGCAHDMMHRTDKVVSGLGVALQRMSLVPAGDFVIEHVARHHAHMVCCLPGDLESAPRGHSYYAFLRGVVVDTVAVEREVENRRLARLGLPVWSWHNRRARTLVVRVAVVVALFASFSWPVVLVGLGALFAVFASFTSSGYLQHYGLRRELREDGRPVPISLDLTWDRNDPIGRYLFFGGTRHPVHHLQPTMPYWDQLRVPTSRYELPASYYTLGGLALFPPLFYRVMDRHLDRLRAGSPRWRARRLRGCDLTDDQIDALLDLRHRSAPTSAPEADGERAAALFRRASSVFVLEADDGSFGGSFAIREEPRPGFVLLHISGMYARPELRGHPALTWMLVWSGVHFMLRWPLRPAWYVATCASPLGYRSVKKFGGLMGHTKDGRLPEAVRDAMHALTAAEWGARYDSATHTVRALNRPPLLTEGHRARYREEGWWDDYVAAAPRWESGEGVVAYYRVRLRDYVAGFTNWLSRQRPGVRACARISSTRTP
jgi:hypothetical protein